MLQLRLNDLKMTTEVQKLQVEKETALREAEAKVRFNSNEASLR